VVGRNWASKHHSLLFRARMHRASPTDPIFSFCLSDALLKVRSTGPSSVFVCARVSGLQGANFHPFPQAKQACPYICAEAIMQHIIHHTSGDVCWFAALLRDVDILDSHCRRQQHGHTRVDGKSLFSFSKLGYEDGFEFNQHSETTDLTRTSHRSNKVGCRL
jgi:hypothetical protein